MRRGNLNYPLTVITALGCFTFSALAADYKPNSPHQEAVDEDDSATEVQELRQRIERLEQRLTLLEKTLLLPQEERGIPGTYAESPELEKFPSREINGVRYYLVPLNGYTSQRVKDSQDRRKNSPVIIREKRPGSSRREE